MLILTKNKVIQLVDSFQPKDQAIVATEWDPSLQVML